MRGRVEDYVQIFTGASDIVDVGCGRGELLSLLRARGVKARGVDTSPAMVELCRSAGLDVEQGDALGYLQRQPDGSIGGLVAIQVVEHFAPAYLTRFLETAVPQDAEPARHSCSRRSIRPAGWRSSKPTFAT